MLMRTAGEECIRQGELFRQEGERSREKLEDNNGWGDFWSTMRAQGQGLLQASPALFRGLDFVLRIPLKPKAVNLHND